MLIWAGILVVSDGNNTHPALTAIPALDLQSEVDRTPSWHNNERQMGVSSLPSLLHVCLGVGALLGC